MLKYKRTGFNWRVIARSLLLLIYDAMAIMVSMFMALFVRFEFSINERFLFYWPNILAYTPVIIIVSLLIFAMCSLYSSIWTYASIREMVNITVASLFVTIFQVAIFFLLEPSGNRLPRSYFVLFCGFVFALTFFVRFLYRAIREFKSINRPLKVMKRVMIVGAGEAGDSLIKEIKANPHLNKKVVCIIDDAKVKAGKKIHGIRIVGDRTEIVEAAKDFKIDEILIAVPSAKADDRKEILNLCKLTGKEMMMLPGIYQIVNGEVSIGQLKEVDVNDLLGRDPIKVDLNSIMDYVSGKVIMVTGGGGSIGSELCRQIAVHKPKKLIIVDIYENSAYDIQLELKHNFPYLDLEVLIASVRNTKRIEHIFEEYRPNIVYHAAAHKHVPLMEDSPNEAIKNNVLGTWKIAEAAHKWGVKKFVMISTDKAVNPTSIMGASKRICEMIIQTYSKKSATEFVAVRFGNVLGSNGSVIPLFKKQIAEGGPVTITHPDIIRYFMTIPEAVSLVLQAGAYAKGGEIFVLDMGKPVKIADLAKNLILLSGHKPDEDIKIIYTGLRPGEKLYEELLMDEEGLENTENELIHIGKPIEIDEEKFMAQLEQIRDYVEDEPEDIKHYVKQIVPTYTGK
jgi:FlaA1/EpsC-like NDP-sugar epimerase